MARLSLRSRMALLFMLVVTAVLGMAAVSFDYFCRLHFEHKDAQILDAKTSVLESILRRGNDLNADVVSEINGLIDTSFGFAAAIVVGERVVYSHHNPSQQLVSLINNAQSDRWVIEVGPNRYSGLTTTLEGWPSGEDGVIHLALDVTHRTHFFEMIREWFIYTLIVSAFLSGALGFIFIRKGLKPIKKLSKASSTITANCLDTRISNESVPSELHELVDNFNAMLERLDQSFLRLSGFSADIAHELRTPLNSMLTQTEVALMKDRDSTDYKDILFSTLEELRRMARMVDDMLFLAKADNGMIAPDFETHDLTKVAASVVEFYEYAAEEKGIDFVLRCNADHTWVKGDNSMLRRAISNIVSNAMRYGDPESSIAIDIAKTGQQVSLQITNRGITIPPEHLDKLFERFHRVDSARREGSTLNAGLGMAITRSIIEAHNGLIGCRSMDGYTTFEIKLPASI
ncbi:MAG TPA: heavy metal sensor histidine kinase [Pseudomonas xinjiangensis]|uniref:Sensor protein n=2 Tax=root TaxID=1 RepID=A0A7V1BPC2_9GAMM|nr:heavy metal sensor histidine kinase [Halopseudomonas xinjiangensis]HEC47651.1 heavy metal sensor histidine kinase [Halopseudomonas xinjiangensis]